MANSLTALPDPAFWQAKRVFLTGHTGFKGSWLAVWLRRLGAEVTGFALPAETPGLARQLDLASHIVSIEGDIRDLRTLTKALQAARPDIVLHLAAQALVRRSYAQPIETLATNVMGTAHLLEAVLQAPGVQAVVVVTTDKCYENAGWVWPYRETDPLGGHDPYSASKACAELVTAAWRRSFFSQQARPAVATARAGNVIGGGDWSSDRLVPDCIRAFAAGQPVELRNPQATRPWQHVLEPLCGYLLLAQHLATAGQDFATAWNFGPAMDDVQPVSVVVDMLARAWGGGSWRMTQDSQPHEAGLLAVDASLARSQLGWRPRLRLEQALAWTGRFYRAAAADMPAWRLIERDIEQYEHLDTRP